MVTALFVVIFLVAAGFGVKYVVMPIFSSDGDVAQESSDYDGPGTGEVQVTIPDGASGTAMGKALTDAGVTKSVAAFVAAFNGNPNSGKIAAGTYTLAEKMKASDVIIAMLDPESSKGSKISVPEGFTASKVFDRVANYFGVSVDSVRALGDDPAALGIPASAVAASEGCPVVGCRLEGWLYPSTYTMTPTDTPATALKQMVAKRVTEMQASGVPEDQWHAVLTKASILEKEVNSAENYPKVARVIENRLAKDWFLGMDTAVMYGAGATLSDPGSLDFKDASNPYNVYVIKGLPPTPISNPSETVVNYTLHPAEGPWMYFVTVNLETGETKFTDSSVEFDAFVAEYKAWKADHPQYYTSTSTPAPQG